MKDVDLREIVLNKQEHDNKWGHGIPTGYSEKLDVMSYEDLYNFGVEFIYRQLLQKGYKFIQRSDKSEVHPSLVMKKDDQLYFIYVEAAIARKFPRLDDYHRYVMLEHAKRFNAIAMYAPVSFGSSDKERFNAGLALKDDTYFAHYEGLKEIVKPSSVDIESDYYMCSLLTKLGEGYKERNVDKFIKYIDEEARWYSPYSKTLYTNKTDIRNYYYNKFILIDEDKIDYFLCYDKESGNRPLLFIAQKSSKVNSAILISIEINSDGKIAYLKILNPKTVKYGL